MHKSSLAIIATVALLAGCGGVKPEVPQQSKANKPDTSNIEIDGDRDDPVNKLAIEAIADLQEYWAEQYPKLYDEDYKPLDGGLYASTPDSETGPECAEGYADVAAMVAIYCRLDDSIAWDAADGLPGLQKKFGDFVIPVILAHEFGHAVQQRSGAFDQNELVVSNELQADCFAGAWARHAKDDGIFDVNAADLDRALAGVLDLADYPGTTSDNTPTAHGSGFDRVSAFQDGYDNEAEACKDYKDGVPEVQELPFEPGSQDEAQGGNAPYDSIVNGVPYDIEDYWTRVYPELTDGQPWTPLKNIEPFDPSSPPDCGGTSAEGYVLFYCVPDDYVAWDNVDAMPVIHDQAGDYAVTTLLATQWGLAALNRLGDDSDEKTSTARGDCLAGAYTASVILQNRRDTSSWTMSPGDLDEAIKALLLFRGDGDVDRQGAGFDRVRAFREGVINGAPPCLEYQA